MTKGQFFFLGCVVGFLLGVAFAKHVINAPQPQVITKVDTLYLRDTITRYTPIVKERRIKDTIIVAVPEYVTLRDSVFVPLEREEVVYEDSTYKAVISGVMPSLDSIWVYRNNRIVTIEKERLVQPRFSMGIQLGTTFRENKILPYFGLGIQYNLLNWK